MAAPGNHALDAGPDRLARLRVDPDRKGHLVARSRAVRGRMYLAVRVVITDDHGPLPLGLAREARPATLAAGAMPPPATTHCCHFSSHLLSSTEQEMPTLLLSAPCEQARVYTP